MTSTYPVREALPAGRLDPDAAPTPYKTAANSAQRSILVMASTLEKMHRI